MLHFPGGSVVKNLPANARDASLIPESGRSPGEANGSLLQYSCLENRMEREAWGATVHGVARIGHDLVTIQQQRMVSQFLFETKVHPFKKGIGSVHGFMVNKAFHPLFSINPHMIPMRDQLLFLLL